MCDFFPLFQDPQPVKNNLESGFLTARLSQVPRQECLSTTSVLLQTLLSQTAPQKHAMRPSLRTPVPSITEQ